MAALSVDQVHRRRWTDAVVVLRCRCRTRRRTAQPSRIVWRRRPRRRCGLAVPPDVRVAVRPRLVDVDRHRLLGWLDLSRYGDAATAAGGKGRVLLRIRCHTVIGIWSGAELVLRTCAVVLHPRSGNRPRLGIIDARLLFATGGTAVHVVSRLSGSAIGLGGIDVLVGTLANQSWQ